MQLPNADGVPQGWDVVHAGEQVLLRSLGLEDDRANSFNLDSTGVVKFDRVLHAGVLVGELTLTSHVVRCTSIEVLAVALVIASTFVEEGVGARFVKVDLCGASRCRKGKC